MMVVGYPGGDFVYIYLYLFFMPNNHERNCTKHDMCDFKYATYPWSGE